MRITYVVFLLLFGCLPISPSGDQKASNNISRLISSVEGFEQTLHPLVKKHCSSCHAESVNPRFAQSDANKAHDSLVQGAKVNMYSPHNSTIVTRLREDGHECWSDCKENSESVQEAIEKWRDLSISEQESKPSGVAVSTLLEEGKLEWNVPLLGEGAESATLLIDVKPFEGGHYLLSNVRLLTSTFVRIRGIKFFINDTYDPGNATFARVDVMVSETNPQVSSASIIILADKGSAEDYLNVTVDKAERTQVDRQALQAQREVAKLLLDNAAIGQNPGQYQTDAYRQLLFELERADSLLANVQTVQDQLDDVFNDLLTAAANFRSARVPLLDKTQLLDLISATSQTLQAAIAGDRVGQHPPSAIQTLEQQLNYFRHLSKSDFLTQTELSQTLIDFSAFVETFLSTAVPPADLTALSSEIAGSVQFVEQAGVGNLPSLYPQSAYDEFLTAINTAQGIFDDQTTPQSEIDQTTKSLDDAKAAFMASQFPLADRQILLPLVDEVTSLINDAVVGDDPGQYAQSDVALLQTALNAALEINEKLTATQAEVDQQIVALMQARDLFLSSVKA